MADRHTPMPGLTRLPGWLLAKLSRPQKALLAVAAALITGAGALAVSALIDTGKRDAADEKRAEGRRAEAELRRLREDQRPRRAAMPVRASSPAAARAALERAITRDVRERVGLGLLDGPVAGTRCDPIGVPGPTGYNCFTLRASRRANYTIESGYRFSARTDTRGRTLVWCKRNPRPIHPDTAYFRTVPISRDCLPG